MAIPVITDHFQAQWIWQGPSGLPEDVFVNTWYFRNDDALATPEVVGSAIQSVLAAFYGAVNGSATSALTAFMSDVLGSALLKIYDLGQALPRYPVYESDTLIVPTSTSGQLPREVSVVGSFYSARGPRRRGRHYLGPLVTSAMEQSGTLERAVPSSALTTAIRESYLNVLNTSENVTWAQVSTTYGEANPVLGGWIDNAFDTQRRRGGAPTSRVVWGTAL